MILSNINQVNIDSISLTQNFNLIVASGTEGRCTYLSKRLSSFKHFSEINKIALGFINWRKVGNRERSDSFFNKNKFKSITLDGEEDKSILNELKKIVKQSHKKIEIIVDYSSMTRIWYAAILNFFKFLKSDAPVSIYFCYSSAKFVEIPQMEFSNTFVGPLKGFSYLSVPTKPSSLIINLGYEAKRAIGLKEYFDSETFLLYPITEERSLNYVNEIEKRNFDLIKRINPSNIIRYPFFDLKQTYSIILNLCNDLLEDYRIVLAPCGAKNFSLLCLITSMKLNNVDVWRISAGKSHEPLDRIPDGEISVLKVDFVPDL